MSLELDKRQRAMLREMGVQVWLPETPAVPVPVSVVEAPQVVKAPATLAPSVSVSAPKNLATSAPARPPAAVRPRPVAAPLSEDGGRSAWHLGEAQQLYADSAVPGAPRWLVLTEMPTDAGPAARFEDDAGKLLDNMLRAARLPVAGAAWLAPLVRHSAGPMDDALRAALANLVAQTQAHIVLVMGRFASQALLNTAEPLGKLRAEAHAWQGAPVVVTYDATYLLRTPADKAKAWQDLRLAMRLMQAV